MYCKFHEIPTTSQYFEVLSSTIEYFSKNSIHLQEGLATRIVEELIDIQQFIEDKMPFVDTENIDERYDLGAIALNILEDESEAQFRLIDVFWGIIHYTELLKDD